MRKEYDFSKAKRGPVVPGSKGKTRITIRLDDDVVEWFKAEVHAAGGGNYQTLMNHALREYMANSQEPLEEVLRQVLREELTNAG
jgi:uncharacterized protein (DUF4415 family)